MLTPFPGTVDFQRWKREMGKDGDNVDGIPLTRHWLIPQSRRPKVYTPHPTLSASQIRSRTQEVCDRFYSLRVWARSSAVRSGRWRPAFVLVSKLYRQMYANTGIATDSARIARIGPVVAVPRTALSSPIRYSPLTRSGEDESLVCLLAAGFLGRINGPAGTPCNFLRPFLNLSG